MWSLFISHFDKSIYKLYMKKIYDETFKKGVQSDDQLNEVIKLLNPISHKPTSEESEIVNGDIGDWSYFTILDKKIRIILYVED